MLSRQMIGPIAIASISKTMMKTINVKTEVSQDIIDRLNQRDKDVEMKHTRKKLSEWKPLKPYLTELNFIHEGILSDLNSIRIIYQVPLMEHHKVHVRQRIFEVYKKAKNDIEKELVRSVLLYYNLLE